MRHVRLGASGHRLPPERGHVGTRSRRPLAIRDLPVQRAKELREYLHQMTHGVNDDLSRKLREHRRHLHAEQPAHLPRVASCPEQGRWTAHIVSDQQERLTPCRTRSAE